jgi:hypothetical protein
LSTQHNDEKDPHYHLDSGFPIFTPALEDPDPQKRADRESDKSYKDEQLALQRKIFYTQIGLAVFGLLGLCVSGWQARTAQQSADTADKSILLAQKTGRDSRKAAEDQARQSIEQFRLDQRAWVSFSGIKEGFAEQAESSGSEMTNTGKTPARDITVTTDVFIRKGTITLSNKEAALMEKILTQSPIWNENTQIDQQLTDDRHLVESQPTPSGPLSPPQASLRYTYAPSFAPHLIVGVAIMAPFRFRVGVLSPNDRYPIRVLSLSSAYKTDGSKDSAFDSERSIVVFGRIVYTDIFSKQRITSFCSMRQDGIGNRFAPCPVYNDMH